MTVAELIEALKTEEPEAVVVVSDYNSLKDEWSQREAEDVMTGMELNTVHIL